jgi:hypothetical protein
MLRVGPVPTCTVFRLIVQIRGKDEQRASRGVHAREAPRHGAHAAGERIVATRIQEHEMEVALGLVLLSKTSRALMVLRLISSSRAIFASIGIR